MEQLLAEIRKCRVCENQLEFGCRPVFSAHSQSKILIVGQAPGSKVHASGIPWDDQSGDNLRNWMGVDKSVFYDPQIFGIVPMGFCYPGKGSNGDLPPRPECAPLWHEKLLVNMPSIQMVLLIGQYAQNYYLQNNMKSTLTETVMNFEEYLPRFFPLPHPSPRNNIWQAKNDWFKSRVLPKLKNRISEILVR